MTYKLARAEFNRKYFSELLKSTDYNMSKAARVAGLDRSDLYRRVYRYGVRLPPVRRVVEREEAA